MAEGERMERMNPVAIEQWMAGAIGALAVALLVTRCLRLSLLIALVALTLEAAALAGQLGLQRYLGMGPARLAVGFSARSIRFCIINVNIQSEGLISRLVVLPLPLLLTGFAASELSLKLQPFRIQLCATGLSLAVRCLEANEWNKDSAVKGAQSAALSQLEMLFFAMERRHREVTSPPAKKRSLQLVKQLVDLILDHVEVQADGFALKLEAMRYQGEEAPQLSPERFLAHIQVGRFHLPSAVPEVDPQVPCPDVSACSDGEYFCPRVQRDIRVRGFSLNVVGAAGVGLRQDSSSSSSQPQMDLFGSMPEMQIRLAMPPVLCQLLSGSTRPWRRISAHLTGVPGDTSPGALNANEALMKVVWTLLGRYLAAGAYCYQLQLAELKQVGGAQAAAEGRGLPPPSLTKEKRLAVLDELRRASWAQVRNALPSECSYYDLLALRVEAAGFDSQVSDARRLWRTALDTMNKYSKVEGLFHELHVSMGLSLDIDLEMGAGRISADLGWLFAKLGPKGTLAGLEVVHGMAVDAHERTWCQGASARDTEQMVLVRGGSKLPRRERVVEPSMWLAAFLPAEPGSMQVTLKLNQARARILPSPLLGTVLPAVLGLLRQDPRPPAPELPDHFTEEHLEAIPTEAHLPDTILGGMALHFEMDVRESCAVLPLKPQLPSKMSDLVPKTDLDYDGLVVSADVINATLVSSPSEESLVLSVDAPSVVAPGGYKIMEPMSLVELRYVASWYTPSTGAKVPLRSANIRLPMASLSVSLAVMRMLKKTATALAQGFASDEQANMEENAPEEGRFARVRRLFTENDVDESGELERTEVFKLAERLCVDNYALSHQELIGAFDEIWTAMDSSNDGKVSFEEFCDALAGGEGRSASKNFGPLSLRAGELASKSFLEGHDEEDDQASKARLWNLLHEDIQAQVGGGSNSSPLTLQWKLLRALRNYSDAKEWWESTLRPEVAPDAHWEIEPDRPVLSARELMFAALSDSGQIQQITEEKTATAQSRRTGPRHRSGLKLRMACDGFRLNLEDPLSQLRGQHRLSLGAASDSDDSKAFDLELTYWHATGHRHLSFEDQLKATIVVRGFFSSCMNPCHHHPEFIMESWGFNVCVDSPAGVKALTCRFIADCHFVMNVTSSLLLGVKPIVRTLMPPEDPDAFRGDISQSAGGTAPLAHLLQGLRRLTQEKLQEFKLILNDPDAAGVGTKVPGEEIVQVSTGPPRGLDRRGSNKAKWMIPFELNSAKNLARIMLPAGWHVTELHQTDMLQFELFVEAEARSDPPEPSEIVVWSVDTASAGASAGTLAQDQESNHSPTSRTEEDSPETRSCQSSRTLRVLNRCGVPGEVWFERGSKQRIGPVEVLEADGQPSTVVVPDVRCSLCVGVTEVSVYKSAEARPDLSSFGRCGAPIKALQGIMSSRGAERGAERGEVQSCLTASLSIGPQGQALLELLPPLELQNGTQLPLHLHLHPPYGNHAVAAQMGIFGLTRASAAWAAPNLEPKVAIVPPGGTFQVPLHMLQKVNTESHGFGQHFWQVLAEAIPPKKNHCSLAFAFPLGGSILRSGREELELRRSLGLALETTSITGSGPEKTTLQRFTLLLLPGLRVVNSLPVKLLVVLQREKIRDEHCDVEPGGTADFGRSPFGGKLLLAVEGEEPQVLDLPAEALSDRSKFKELKMDQLRLSSNMSCSLHCSWQAGQSPEMVITGKCLLFNKTGLTLQVAERVERDSAQQPAAQLCPGGAAVLGTEAEVCIGLGLQQVVSRSSRDHPEKSQQLELRGFADVQDAERLFCWRSVSVRLSQGRLQLKRQREASEVDGLEQQAILWPLSRYCRCMAAEPQNTGGVKDCFSLEDPSRGQSLVFHAPDSATQREWLMELQRSVQILQEEDEITKGWDKDGGACRRGKVPDELWETWCTSGVPIMAIGEGELMVTAGSSESPSVMFLGVQVHAVLGIPRFPGKGVTVTPRFILRNASESFVQVMPGLLPNKKSGDEPAVTNRVEEIIKEFSGPDTMDIMEFIARDPIADQAVWIPPGESLAIFHFPLRCQASEVSQARKAVALRLPGREPLQLIHVEAKGPLQLQQVLTSGVIPYKDHPWQSGRLPPRMRMLAQEGRLMCLRWKYLKDFQLGDLILTSACEMFIGLPISELGAEWLRKEPWKECEALDLRSQGHHKITLQMFTAQMKAGRCNFDGVGRGCVIFLAQRIDNDYDLQMGKGLPWSGWLGLNNTQEKVVALSSAGSTGGASGVSFMRCSVQVRNSTAFMILSDEPPPYRVENWSDSRTLAVRFLGDDYCEILPPLSWFAFDWPTRAQHEKKERYLILQDLLTEKKEIYQAHDLGLGPPLKLDTNAVDVTGQNAELTEDGFKEIVLKEDPREMEHFVARVAQDLGTVASSSSTLPELTMGALSLREMRQQMIERGLVEPQKPSLTKRGREKAMLCHYTMTTFLKFLLHTGGFAAKESHLSAFAAASSRLPNLLQLLEKLPEEVWVKKERTPEQAFQDLLAVSDVEHTANALHLLVRRVLEEDLAVQPKSVSTTEVHALAKEMANGLRNGQWPQGKLWQHFLMEVKQHCLPSSRAAAADSRQGSEDEAPDEEEAEQPTLATAVSFRSDGALDEIVGKTEPLSQDGFSVVHSLQSHAAMAAFLKRILLDERGEVNDQAGFAEFVQSCVDDPPSFTSLQQEILRGPSWAVFRKMHGKLYVDRFFDGTARVFSVRDQLLSQGTDKGSSVHFDCWDIDLQLAGAQICVVFQTAAHSLGCDHVTGSDEEIFAVTVDHIQLRKKSAERKTKFIVHHFQIDNMREADRSRPIIICPEDSGYYSDRRETLKNKKNQEDPETIPFLYFCVEDVPSGILHFKELELLLQPVVMRLDMEFWIEIGQQLLRWVSSGNSNAAAAVQGFSSEDRQIMETQIRHLREGGIDVPSGKTTLRPIYLEQFRLGALIAQVEFLMPMKKTAKILKQSKAASGSDSATTLEDAEDQFDTQWLQSMWLSRVLARLTYRSHGLMKTVLTVAQKGLVFVITSVGSGVLSSIGHVTPRFALPETVIQSEFTDLTPFANGLFRNYMKHGMWESYKVLGSMNILGDPIGWTLSVGGGVKQFFLKTGSEVLQGDLKGEGVLSLAQGVVGGTAAHVGKFFGALGDTVDALAQTGDAGQNYLPGSVNHVGDGVIVGTQVFGRHVVSGMTGLVKAPIHGFRDKGWRGLGEGFLKGVRGAVAQPVSGLMHGAQHIADGVDATTRLWDHWGQISVRRSARSLQHGRLLPLVGAEFSPRVTVWVDSLEFLTMESFVGSTFAVDRQLRGATYRVQLRAGDWNKPCKLGRLAPNGAIQFDQAKWVPIQTLLEADLNITVQDCTLPGHLDYDMQIVYTAKLHRNFILQQVAQVLREPEDLAVVDDYTCRWRPSSSCRVRLDPTSDSAPAAELLLRFWPAWDPVRVPKTQQWVPKRLSTTAEKRPHPDRKEGLLMKKSKGLLHHWSEKWVVLENHEFKYWSDRKDYEQQEPPKVIGEIQSADTWDKDLRRIKGEGRKLDYAQVRDRQRNLLPLWVARTTQYQPEQFPLQVLWSKATFRVCYRLADPKCKSRFAAGSEPESYFIQLNQDGEVEAQWQPADREQEPVKSWLQAVLRHSILD